MTVFVDTGVFYADADEDAPRHDPASSALRPVLAGRFGRPVTSYQVLGESFTLTRVRTGRFDLARTVVARIRGEGSHPDIVTVLGEEPGSVQAAADVLDRYRDHALSFTDATTVALVEDHGIDHVLSFDDDFDGVVDRIDPAVLAG